MRKYRAIISLLAVLAFQGKALAQSYFTSAEFGFMAGGSQYFGDLNQHYGFKTISPAYGGFVRKHYNYYIALKGTFAYTTVGYDDKYNKTDYERLRNLSFKSTIMELGAQAEFNFFKFVTGDVYNRFTPYLTAGIGAFYYNPYTTYKGVDYYLQPLGTEGQNLGYNQRKYSNFAVCFPIGAGVKYWLKAGINVSFEIADRFTSTDYLDDVSTTYIGSEKFPKPTVYNPVQVLQDRSSEVTSDVLGRAGKQRGNSNNNDQYLVATFCFSWHFTTYRCPQFMQRDLIKTY